MTDRQETARSTLALTGALSYAGWKEAVQYVLTLTGLKWFIHVQGSVAKAAADSSGKIPSLWKTEAKISQAKQLLLGWSKGGDSTENTNSTAPLQNAAACQYSQNGRMASLPCSKDNRWKRKTTIIYTKNKHAENGEMMGGIRGDAGSCVKDYGSLPALQ